MSTTTKLRKDMGQMGAVSAAIEERVTEEVTKKVRYEDAVSMARAELRRGIPREEILKDFREAWPELSAENAEKAVEEAEKSLKKKKKAK